MNSQKINSFNKKAILIFGDLLIVTFAIVAAYSIRLEKFYFIQDIDYKIFLIFYLVFFIIFYFMKIYQILIRFFDIFSIKIILKAILVFQFFIVLINFLIYENIYMPRSISFIAPVIIAILIVLFRIVLNYIIKDQTKNNLRKNNILIVGINKNSVELLTNLRQHQSYGVVKGFIDPSSQYRKRQINGINIYKKKNIFEVIKKNNISEIIISPKSISTKDKEILLSKFQDQNIRIITMDKTTQFNFKLIRKSLESKIDFYDIVDRPEIETNKIIFNKIIRNKNFLITGGGGSIGSELCLQIIKFNPKNIYILENSEFNLFNICKKLNSSNHKCKIYPILADCSDKDFLIKKFSNIKIDYIYHAAAYKHVGYGELNPYSIIKNNIFGTLSILQFAIKKKVKDFIFVSTDKAVNPTSLLGLTKKFGEIITYYYYKKIKYKKGYKFSVVRFGNVIGSSGSVIPIFLDQIKKNNSLTVTHKEVERYFMSITEAVKLIIHSASIGTGFNIFALDMGKQIKILSIAKRIIRLSGNTVKNKQNPRGDIGIKFIGLKKGEKISEEISLGKKLKKTIHSKINICEDKLNSYNMIKRLNLIEMIMLKKKFDHKSLARIVLK